MKKLKKNTKFLILACIVTILFSIIGTVNAAPIIDTTQKGSLTIKKYEQASGSTENIPLEGVTFTIYPVTEEVETLEAAETYITTNAVTGTEQTTTAEGTVKFENLELGRYYVKETAYPENVVSPIDPFLVDIPMTNEDGTAWVYDVVAEPKNQTVYGDVTLIKKDALTTSVMAGVTFKLQKLTDVDTWTDYEIDSSAEFTTSAEGTIAVENLSAGKYRFIETATLDGYILDQSVTYEFEVLEDQTEAIVVNVTNEKVAVEQQVKPADGSYGSSVGVFETDTVNVKTTTSVPSVVSKLDTYIITDVISENIVVDTNNIVVSGVKDGTTTALPADAYTIDTTTANTIIVTVDTSKLVDENGTPLYDDLTVEYTGTLTNLENVYGQELVNTSKVEFTNVINSDGTTETTTTTNTDSSSVHTGKVLIYKTNSSNQALPGAEFKIATSEANAKAGTFVKGADGQDLLAVSDENGYVIFSGLKYDSYYVDEDTLVETSYWIVETKAPEDYNLLKQPVEVIVNSTSGTYDADDTVQVINKKGFELPITGATGAILFTLLGLLIIIIAIILIKKSTESKEENRK